MMRGGGAVPLIAKAEPKGRLSYARFDLWVGINPTPTGEDGVYCMHRMIRIPAARCSQFYPAPGAIRLFSLDPPKSPASGIAKNGLKWCKCLVGGRNHQTGQSSSLFVSVEETSQVTGVAWKPPPLGGWSVSRPPCAMKFSVQNVRNGTFFSVQSAREKVSGGGGPGSPFSPKGGVDKFQPPQSQNPGGDYQPG